MRQDSHAGEDMDYSAPLQVPLQATEPKQGLKSAAGTSSGLSVIVVETLDDLKPYRSDIDDLAVFAADDNLFHEPWMLFPAIECLAGKKPVLFVLVFRTSREDPTDRRLCGFFPLERRSSYMGLSVPHLAMFSYPYCFKSTPLLHRDHFKQTVQTFLDWVRLQSRIKLLDMQQISRRGCFHRAVKTRLELRNIRYTEKRFTRACFVPDTDSATYWNKTLSAKARSKFRRLERRLSELGRLECDELSSVDDFDRWIEEFLVLEASGWKNSKGTAIGLSTRDRQFFWSIAREGFHRKRMMMMALRLEGKAVAMLCNFRGGGGSYGYKTAYDENFRHFSPGMLLFLKMIDRLHLDPEIRWLDSCAAPDNVSANQIFSARRIFCNMTVSNSPITGNTVLVVVEKLKRLRQLARATRAGAGRLRLPRLKHSIKPGRT